MFLDERRIGDPANPSNQSLSGAIARLTGSLQAAYGWWLAAALVTLVTGLAIACWAHRRGRVLAGAICCGLTGALISPISWTHHWVWCVPLLIMLAAAAFRLRSAGPALAAVAAGAVFSGTISLPWPGRHPVLPQQWQDDLYVLAGLAVLAATAAGLALETLRPGRKSGAASEP